MRYFIAALSGGVLLASNAQVSERVVRIYQEPIVESVTPNSGVRVLGNPVLATVVATDSGCNQWSYVGISQDPVAQHGTDYVAWVHRVWDENGVGGEPLLTGILKLHYTRDGGATWVEIDTFNYKIIGQMPIDPGNPSDTAMFRGGRYPHVTWAFIGDSSELYPVVSWPELGPGTPYDWGYPFVGTGFVPPIGDHGDDLDAFRNFAVPTPTGKILTIANDVNYLADIGVYDPATGTYEVPPQPMIADVIIGAVDVDPNTGVYVFVYNSASGAMMAYILDWTGNVVDSVVFNILGFEQGGYQANVIMTFDGVVARSADASVPLMVVGLSNYTGSRDSVFSKAVAIATPDTTYLVHFADPANPDDYLLDPQVSTDIYGNVAVMWTQVTQFDANVGYGWYDIYYTTSNLSDLSTWTTPENATQTTDVNEGLLHVPPHFYPVDASTARLWFTYAYDPYNQQDVHYISDMGDVLVPTYFDLCYVDVPIVGVHESASATRPSYRFDGRSLSFLGLPAGTRVQVFNASGRLVKDVRLDESGRVSLADLGSGAYFFRAGQLTGKAVVR